MSMKDFQNGFIAGVATKGTLPLFTGVVDGAQVGDILRITDEGKVGLAGSIELSRVVPETIENKAVIVENGKIVLIDTIPFRHIVDQTDETNISERGLLQNLNGIITSNYLASGHLEKYGTPGQILQVGDDNQIEAIWSQKRFFLFIGDSYAAGYGDPDNLNEWYYDGNQWPNFAATALGLKEEDYAIFAQGGSGLVTYGDNEYSFEKLIKFAVDKHEDDTIPGYCHYSTYPINGEKVTDIVIGGGYNDQWTNVLDILIEGAIKNENTKERYKNTGMRSLYQTIKTFYPNARIHFFNLGWDMDAATRFRLQFNSQYYYAAISRFNTSYVNLSYKLHNRGLFSYDGFHPNKTGEEVLGTAIASILLGGEPEEREYFPIGVTSSNRENLGYIDSFSHKGLHTFFFTGTEFLASNLSQEGFSHSFIRYASCDGENYSIQNPEYSICLIDLGEIIYGNNILQNGMLGTGHYAWMFYEDGTSTESPAQLYTGVMRTVGEDECFINYTTTVRPNKMTTIPHLYLHFDRGFDTTKKIKKITMRQYNDTIGIETL